jgi:hypothetical protein
MRESARQRRAVISPNYLKNKTLLEAQELPNPQSFLERGHLGIFKTNPHQHESQNLSDGY